MSEVEAVSAMSVLRDDVSPDLLIDAFKALVQDLHLKSDGAGVPLNWETAKIEVLPSIAPDAVRIALTVGVLPL